MATITVFYCPGCEIHFRAHAPLQTCPECGAPVEFVGGEAPTRPKHPGPPNTPAQKKIFIVLFEGGAIRKGAGVYRLFTCDGALARKFSGLTFRALEPYLLASEKGFIPARDKILEEKKTAWIRREYLRRLWRKEWP